MRPFSVRVAGSSANIGSGFDSLAVALDCWLHVHVAPHTTPGICDAGAPDLLGGENLVIDAMHLAATRLGFDIPDCIVRVESDIPVARGLGSSAAALVAGVVAAGVAAGRPVADDEIINVAGDVEGHADNVSASVLGGVTVSIRSASGWIADVIARELPWTPVAFIPAGHAFTSEARALLPASVPMDDVIANVGRAALLVHAFHSRRGDLLRDAMHDRLHQPYRATIFHHLEPCIAAAVDAGAFGASLSGAGPAILAFAPPEHAERVGAAMRRAAVAYGIEGASRCLAVPSRGLHIDR